MPLDVKTLLQTLVSFKTVSNKTEGLQPTSDCPKYINSVLDGLGFETKLLEHNDVFTVFGKIGNGSPRILFLAHFDVVPPGEGWKTDPFTLRINNDRAYGRGACDDKGNVAALMLLAEKLADMDPKGTIMLAATGDEEVGGLNGAGFLRDYLAKEKLTPEYVLVADGTNETIIFRRRNILPTQISARSLLKKIRGRVKTLRFETDIFGTESRHSAYMRLGVDRHALLAASKYLDLHPALVVQNIRGGFVKSNMIPAWVELDVVQPDDSAPEIEYDEALTDLLRLLLPITRVSFPTRPSDKGTIICPNLLSNESGRWELYCDIRAMTNNGTSVRDAILDVVGSWNHLISIDVSAGAGFVECDPNSHWIKAAKTALSQIGIPIRLQEGFGASDSRHFAQTGAQLFDFGPVGGSVHGPDEWVSLSSIERVAAFYAKLVEMLTSTK